MFHRTFLLRAAAAGTALVLAGASPAGAHDEAQAPAAPGAPVFLAADLSGRNEVPPADLDGRGRALVRIVGTQVCFTLSWSKIGAPMAGHIHLGAAGVNGPVKVGFFAGALPDPLSAATGCVTGAAADVDAIVANPAGHYVNLHNAEFPGGAIRGQLQALRAGVDLLAPFRSGKLAALLDGLQEIPGPADADGHGTAFVRAHRTEVTFGLLWSGIGAPSAGHIHAGAVGVAGPIVVPLFAAAGGLPTSITGIAGVAPVTPDVSKPIANNPSRYYVNLHNADFPAGAIRGQLFRVG